MKSKLYQQVQQLAKQITGQNHQIRNMLAYFTFTNPSTPKCSHARRNGSESQSAVGGSQTHQLACQEDEHSIMVTKRIKMIKSDPQTRRKQKHILQLSKSTFGTSYRKSANLLKRQRRSSSCASKVSNRTVNCSRQHSCQNKKQHLMMKKQKKPGLIIDRKMNQSPNRSNNKQLLNPNLMLRVHPARSSKQTKSPIRLRL